MALIVSSVFYNLPNVCLTVPRNFDLRTYWSPLPTWQDTSSFYSRGSLLFFAILLSAFGSALEILTLYAQRRKLFLLIAQSVTSFDFQMVQLLSRNMFGLLFTMHLPRPLLLC